METYGVRVSREVGARPEEIYEVLANYREGHPQILPKNYFRELQVLQGGVGSGTVIRVTMNFMGFQRHMRMAVTEPVPGKVLQEEDLDSGVITRFILESRGPATTEVTIETRWPRKHGFGGFLEARINPAAAKKMYREELELLEAYCAKRD